MKFATAAAIVALSLFAGSANARTADGLFSGISQTAPRSLFDDIRSTAPRSLFDDIKSTAPAQPFDALQDASPRSSTLEAPVQQDLASE